MNICARNKKVALARWANIHKKNIKKIRKDIPSFILRALLCGFLSGDGSVRVRRERDFYHYDAYFYPDDKSMLSAYKRAIFYVYGKKVSVKRMPGFFIASTSSRYIVQDLIKYGRFGIYSWMPPHWLRQYVGAREAWLSGFFSAEAHITDKVIRVQTTNLRGMKKLSQLLLDLGIENRQYVHTPKKSHWSQVGIIIIAKKAARIKYFTHIGFCHTRKEKALKKALGL